MNDNSFEGTTIQMDVNVADKSCLNCKYLEIDTDMHILYADNEEVGAESDLWCRHYDLCVEIKKRFEKELKKRNEPQKAEYAGHDGIMMWECPRCLNMIDMFDAGEQVKYCHFCGQRVSF